MKSLRRTRLALTASLALATPLVAIAGCKTPGAPTTPSLGAGAAQAEAYPGTAGHVYPDSGTPIGSGESTNLLKIHRVS